VDRIFLSAFGIPGPSFADPFPGVTNAFPPGSFPFGLTHLTLDNDLRPPYVQELEPGAATRLAGNYLVEVRYVGTKGTHLSRLVEGIRPSSIRRRATSTVVASIRVVAETLGLATSNLSA